MAAAIEVRRFEAADDIIDMKEAGGISIIKMGDGTTGMHATFEPGWTWEKDEKPLLGHPATCPMRHTGYCIGTWHDSDALGGGSTGFGRIDVHVLARAGV